MSKQNYIYNGEFVILINIPNVQGSDVLLINAKGDLRSDGQNITICTGGIIMSTQSVGL